MPADLDKDLVLRFFFAIARFEYALKRTGFLEPDKNWASPDWAGFGSSVGEQFMVSKQTGLSDAVAYLEKNPPRTQVVTNGKLDWRDNRRGKSDSSTVWLLRLVKTVRNNLFHGGKFPGTPVSDFARNPKLLRYGLIVLEEVLRLSPKVAAHFYDEID
jgi:hypothetical protein